ncbi:hypothetical protein ARAM_001841 [Aspergillus rambellii]|uniref:CBF1-interacting co-repressor CIR N-terminal domain-containing protein n=1 Tax=Aspergillus rambellii TaxID=308745 RepID=A0A0F8WKW8_9EURO|nr:hypothetical protein ARAM_001841 [Aspergillus rambellii]
MPLHLLGKKSWNVYNQENIARVRRDEAQAKAQEEEEERRMQEIDAERRIHILRGEQPPTPPPPPSHPTISRLERKGYPDSTGPTKKRRRLAGENDTDRDIRIAREDAELALAKREELVLSHKSDAPLRDRAGHINLFPEEETRKYVEKNPEAEKEAAEKQRSYEDQYTMRFSNAAGFRQNVGQNPWYSSSQGDGAAPDSIPSTDVWGNEDPMRKEREKTRMDRNDPLVAMKKGICQLKSIEGERKKWNEERNRELESLRSTEKTRSHRRRRVPSTDSLEDFKLDATPDRHREESNQRSLPSLLRIINVIVIIATESEMVASVKAMVIQDIIDDNSVRVGPYKVAVRFCEPSITECLYIGCKYVLMKS